MSEKDTGRRHLLDGGTAKCARCGEEWPCAISTATDAGLALFRGEITTDQAVARSFALRIKEARSRYRPCESCGRSPDVHNTNRGADFIGHEYR